jgi:hypothetical protein
MSGVMRHDFHHHGGFQQQFDFPGVNEGSCVLVSICELGIFSGQLIPFQGGASLSIDDVVPGRGNVIVRGNIGWDSDLNVRLNAFLA